MQKAETSAWAKWTDACWRWAASFSVCWRSFRPSYWVNIFNISFSFVNKCLLQWWTVCHWILTLLKKHIWANYMWWSHIRTSEQSVLWLKIAIFLNMKQSSKGSKFQQKHKSHIWRWLFLWVDFPKHHLPYSSYFIQVWWPLDAVYPSHPFKMFLVKTSRDSCSLIFRRWLRTSSFPSIRPRTILFYSSPDGICQLSAHSLTETPILVLLIP